MSRLYLLLLVSIGCWAQGRELLACNVPVFRYALERWRPDRYEIFIFHDQQLSAAEQAIVDQLEKAADDEDKPSNVLVAAVDLTREPAKWVKKLWDEQQPTKMPWVVVRAPSATTKNATVWTGSLGSLSIPELLESTVRKELTRRLLTGESIVWLYLHDGPLAQDDATYQELAEALAEMEKEIPLPAGIGEEGSELHSQLPLKIKFSILPFDRQSPAEAALVRQLFPGNADFAKIKGPIVFPIFGCGRVLTQLDGDDLTPDSYGDVAMFLCGACSCQVKEQNPGHDLLLTVNWIQILEEGWPENETSPPNSPLSPRGRGAGGEGANLANVTTKEPVLVPIPTSKKKTPSETSDEAINVSTERKSPRGEWVDDGGARDDEGFPRVACESCVGERPQRISPALLGGMLIVGLMLTSSCVLWLRRK